MTFATCPSFASSSARAFLPRRVRWRVGGGERLRVFLQRARPHPRGVIRANGARVRARRVADGDFDGAPAGAYLDPPLVRDPNRTLGVRRLRRGKRA